MEWCLSAFVRILCLGAAAQVAVQVGLLDADDADCMKIRYYLCIAAARLLEHYGVVLERARADYAFLAQWHK